MGALFFEFVSPFAISYLLVAFEAVIFVRIIGLVFQGSKFFVDIRMM